MIVKPTRQELATETWATSMEKEREMYQNMYMKEKSISRPDCKTTTYSNSRWFKITGFKAVIWK